MKSRNREENLKRVFTGVRGGGGTRLKKKRKRETVRGWGGHAVATPNRALEGKGLSTVEHGAKRDIKERKSGRARKNGLKERGRA